MYCKKLQISHFFQFKLAQKLIPFCGRGEELNCTKQNFKIKMSNEPGAFQFSCYKTKIYNTQESVFENRPLHLLLLYARVTINTNGWKTVTHNLAFFSFTLSSGFCESSEVIFQFIW